MLRIFPRVPTIAVKRVRIPETKNFRDVKISNSVSDGKPHLVFIVAEIEFRESDRIKCLNINQSFQKDIKLKKQNFWKLSSPGPSPSPSSCHLSQQAPKANKRPPKLILNLGPPRQLELLSRGYP